MKVAGKHYRTIWLKEPELTVLQIIDQTALPFEFRIVDLHTVEEVCRAIRDMQVRGAGLIGVAAAYGMYLAVREGVDPEVAGQELKATRPTARDLTWAVDRMLAAIRGGEVGGTGGVEGAGGVERTSGVEGTGGVEPLSPLSKVLREARAIADESVENGRLIGEHGAKLIKALSDEKRHGESTAAFSAIPLGDPSLDAIPLGDPPLGNPPLNTMPLSTTPFNILTHCNAGWLGFVDYGSALAPVYAAFEKGIDLHLWVDETRPRNQGAFLTTWELSQYGISHDLIVDNAGGHLMQQGMVDLVLVGADRVTRRGDTANKIGTYLKALAAYEHGIPFYVALPSSTFDFSLDDGTREIPIEERDADEVRFISGKTANGSMRKVLLCPEETSARNWGFDVTPARFISGFITERGICEASEAGILSLFPELLDR